MRIVEYEKNATGVACRWLNGVAIAGAAFSFIILILMIGNHLMVKHADPIHAPALLKLTEQLKADPQNVAMREQIRELDFLARHAFFSSQRFQAISIFLLLGSLTVAVIASKTLQTYRARVPYPLGNPPKDDLAENARWARNAITAAGLVLIGIALVLVIPSRSPLDQPKQTEAKITRPSKEEFAKNWPQLFGATSGRAVSTQLPLEWNGTNGQGICWKIELPKKGMSSPIIWNKRIYLAGGDEASREVYCVDTETGRLSWTHAATGIAGSPKEFPKISDDTTVAASTMATDGERVFAIFGTGDLIALDFAGKRIWARNLGVPDNSFGHGSSLAVSDDLLLVQYDQRTNGVFLALDTATGNTKWKTPRAFEASWATPLIAELGGREEFVLAAAPAVASYDPKTGAELWRVAYFGKSEVAPSPVLANGLICVSAEGAGMAAIDVVKRDVVWKDQNSSPGVATALIVGELLFCGLDDGGIICRNAKTGQKIWEADTDEGFYASPLLSGDRIYLLDRAGTTHIFHATNKFNLLGRGALGEEAGSTPAIYENSLYIRGKKHLFRIGS